MAGIAGYLEKILSAVYGRDVRQSIHDAIFQCYEDGKALSEMQLATDEDIDRIIDGTFTEDEPPVEEDAITDEEINRIVDAAFSEGE